MVLDVKSSISVILNIFYMCNIYAAKLLERGTYIKGLDYSANRDLNIIDV